jgi:hypothetical protein
MRIIWCITSEWNAWSHINLLILFILFLHQSSQVRLVNQLVNARSLELINL